MAEIVPGDIVLARESSGRFHAVVRGVRLGRLTVERWDGRPARPVPLRDVLEVFKPAGRPDAGGLAVERLRPTAQMRLDLRADEP
jgi:hypothetical protein